MRILVYWWTPASAAASSWSCAVEDVDLLACRLCVRHAKLQRDRLVYLSPRTIVALRAYLAVRETAATNHLLIQRGSPLTTACIAYRPLGHRSLDKTVLCARIADPVVEGDYYRALAALEAKGGALSIAATTAYLDNVDTLS